MSEPRRLRDEAESAVELLLLDAGVSYRPSADTRAKTLAALGLAGSAAVSVGALSVASSSLSKVGWAKLLLFSGIGAGVVAPVGYVAWQGTHEAPAPLSVSAVTPRAVKTRPVAPVTPAPDTQVPVSLEELPPVAKTETRASSSGTLAAELGALDVARARLASGDPSGALAKLDDYARAYPRGRLVLEAEVLRIDALSRAGQRGQAKKRAESFLRRHPNSVLASRVRGFVD